MYLQGKSYLFQWRKPFSKIKTVLWISQKSHFLCININTMNLSGSQLITQNSHCITVLNLSMIKGKGKCKIKQKRRKKDKSRPISKLTWKSFELYPENNIFIKFSGWSLLKQAPKTRTQIFFSTQPWLKVFKEAVNYKNVPPTKFLLFSPLPLI